MRRVHKLWLGSAALISAALLTAGCDQPQQTAGAPGQRIDRAATNGSPANESPTMDRLGSETASKGGEMAAKAAVALDETAITVKVKAALLADPGLKTLPIDVETKDGVVTLAGKIETDEMRRRVVQVAEATPGVRQVVDKLVVGS